MAVVFSSLVGEAIDKLSSFSSASLLDRASSFMPPSSAFSFASSNSS